MQVQRWGRERTGTQRYRCFGCRRTFNDLTRTAMAGTHLPAKWAVWREGAVHWIAPEDLPDLRPEDREHLPDSSAPPILRERPRGRRIG